MNIDHLQLFVRIAATQNISLAGKELGLSPAVASAHMNKLEASLQVRLLHRTTRQVSLTQEGQTLLPHAQELIEGVEIARASVGAGYLSPRGKLRIAASASFGRMHLLPALSDFFSQYPDLQVDLHLSDSVVDMVEGGFDLAIRDAKLNDSSLVARKLAPVSRIVCASPDYLARHGEPKTPDELLNHACINLVGLDTWTFQTPAGIQRIKTPSRLRTDNGEAARDASVNGLGVIISSTWCCYQQVQAGELVPILKEYPLDTHTAIWAVYPSSRLLAPKVRTFIDYFAEKFSATPYWDQAID